MADPDCPLCGGDEEFPVNVAEPGAPYRALVQVKCLCAVSRPGPKGHRPKESESCLKQS